MKPSAGIADLMLLKTTDSAFRDFHRDQYRTLPDADDRIFATSLTADWSYAADTDWDAAYAAIRHVLAGDVRDTQEPRRATHAARDGRGGAGGVPGVSRRSR